LGDPLLIAGSKGSFCWLRGFLFAQLDQRCCAVIGNYDMRRTAPVPACLAHRMKSGAPYAEAGRANLNSLPLKNFTCPVLVDPLIGGQVAYSLRLASQCV